MALLKKDTRELTTSDKDTADTLCNYFKQVFVDEDMAQAGPTSITGDNSKQFQHEPDSLNVKFTTEKVKEKLCALQGNKSPGPDGIHAMVLHQCAEYLSVPLSVIFQTSYESGQLPEDWKKANISSIYKKGNRQDPGNYRPISLTPVPCKIMESIIKKSVTTFITEKKLD